MAILNSGNAFHGRQNLAETAIAVRHSYHRLVLLVGPLGSGKSRLLRTTAAEESWPIVNVGVELAQILVPIPPLRRSLEAQGAVSNLVAAHRSDTIALDNIEILFDPSLRLQPFELLKQLSRSKTIVAAWPGCAGAELTYAEPGRRDYAAYDAGGVTVLPIQSITGQ